MGIMHQKNASKLYYPRWPIDTQMDSMSRDLLDHLRDGPAYLKCGDLKHWYARALVQTTGT